MISFLENFGEQLPEVRTSCISRASAACSPALMKPSLTDEQRDAAIQKAEAAELRHSVAYEETGLIYHDALSKWARTIKDRLIASRKEQQ